MIIINIKEKIEDKIEDKLKNNVRSLILKGRLNENTLVIIPEALQMKNLAKTPSLTSRKRTTFQRITTKRTKIRQTFSKCRTPLTRTPLFRQ